MSNATSSPEIGRSIDAGGIQVNYHDNGSGFPVLLIHGSGPGVSAYANWRLVMPELAKQRRVLAPDIAGFGYTERKADQVYTLDFWVRHLVDWMDAVGVQKAKFVGNSFGGALTLLGAVRRRLAALLDEADDVRGALVEGLRSARSDLSSAVEMAEERIEAGRAD